MVDLCREIVLRRDGLSSERKYARVPSPRRARRERTQQSPIRQRVKRLEETRSLTVHGHRICRAAIGRDAEMAIACCLRRHGIHLGDSLRLTQTFVISEKECAVFHYGSANGTAELIPMERRLRRVEEIPGVERAIPDVFKSVSVEILRSRSRRGTNRNRSSSAARNSANQSPHRDLGIQSRAKKKTE